MKISYAILTHNEGPYIFSLLTNLIEYKEVEDEIIVVDDFSDDTETLQILEDFSRQKHIKVYKHKLDKDFSSQKNFLMMRKDLSDHPIEKVGEKLRALMPWIGKNKLVDKNKN